MLKDAKVTTFYASVLVKPISRGTETKASTGRKRTHFKSFYFLAYQSIKIISIQSRVDHMRILNISVLLLIQV